MATTTTSSSGGGGSECPAALDLVRPLQPLLAGFAHRNKNQHRGARWFASFAMLRRHVDKLADETAARPPQKTTTTTKKKKKKPKKNPPVAQGGGDDDDDNDNEETDDGPAARRARWLRDVLVPKCYLAFSQLAADNQFATLGVVLLGALAQVRRACVCLVGEALEAASAAAAPPPASALVPTTTTTTTTAAAAAAATTAATPAATPPRPPGGAGGVDEAVDVGEAVSRDALVRATAGDRPPKKRKKLAAGGAHPDAGAGPGDVKPAKKKKKAKKGDEFDDLFSSIF